MSIDRLSEPGLAFLLLGHAALGVLLLANAFAGRGSRTLSLRVAAGAGVILAAALAIAGRGEAVWRGFELDPSRSLIAAVACACAWVLIGATAEDDPRVARGALVGVSASGICLLAAGNWLVPSLLYLLVIGAALVVTTSDVPSRAATWVGLTLGLAGVVVSLFLWWWDGESWLLPFEMSGWQGWFLAGAAAVLAGALPFVGPWGSRSMRGGEVVPVLVGTGFLLLLRPAATAQEWVAVGALLLALGGFAAALFLRRPLSAGLPSSVLLAFAISSVDTSLLPATALATLIALSVALLSRSAGMPETSFILAHLPLTAGFAPLLAAGEISFRRSVEASRVVDALPSSIVTMALPAIVAIALLVCRRTTRLEEDLSGTRGARWASWALLLASLSFALWPQGMLLDERDGQEIVLISLAALVALATFIYVGRSARPALEETVRIGQVDDAPLRWSRALTGLSLLFGLTAVAGAAYLLVEGLKLGFL